MCVCVVWGPGLRGLGFNSPYLLRVIRGKPSNFSEHQLPPRFEAVELTDVLVQGGGE